MFSALGGWWERELQVWAASEGLWGKDYLSQGQAPEPRMHSAQTMELHHLLGVQPWEGLSSHLPWLPSKAAPILEWTASLLWLGDSTSLSLMETHKILEGCPCSLGNRTQFAILLVTGGENILLPLWLPANLPPYVYGQETLVALPTQVPKQLTYANVSKQRNIADEISSLQNRRPRWNQRGGTY